MQNPAGLPGIIFWMNRRAGIHSEAETIGGFTYLDMLKQPFFKIDSDYYMIKGIQGNDYFRIAVHGKHEDQLEELERTITDCMEK